MIDYATQKINTLESILRRRNMRVNQITADRNFWRTFAIVGWLALIAVAVYESLKGFV